MLFILSAFHLFQCMLTGLICPIMLLTIKTRSASAGFLWWISWGQGEPLIWTTFLSAIREMEPYRTRVQVGKPCRRANIWSQDKGWVIDTMHKNQGGHQGAGAEERIREQEEDQKAALEQAGRQKEMGYRHRSLTAPPKSSYYLPVSWSRAAALGSPSPAAGVGQSCSTSSPNKLISEL